MNCWSIQLLRLLFVASPRDVIELPDEEEEVPLREEEEEGQGIKRESARGSGPPVDTGA